MTNENIFIKTVTYYRRYGKKRYSVMLTPGWKPPGLSYFLTNHISSFKKAQPMKIDLKYGYSFSCFLNLLNRKNLSELTIMIIWNGAQ